MRVSWCWLVLCLGAVSLEKRVESLQVQKHMVHTIMQWKYLDWAFPTEKERKEAIDSGRYDYKKCFPVDTDKWLDTVFVTVIGDEGVPASVNTVSGKKGPGGPLLEPYPDWSWYNHKDCNKPHIISVHRVAIDKCDRLWVLDAGKMGSKVTCPPQLLSFDLQSKKLLKSVTVPNEIAVNSTTGQGLLLTPVVRTLGSGCRETHVYIADAEGYAILTYNDRTSEWGRVTSSALDYDPSAEVYTVNGESFNLKDGPVGMALSPTGKQLHFSPISSFKLVSVDTNELDRAKGVANSVTFQVTEDVLEEQTTAKGMSRDGILFMGYPALTAIGCWNTKKSPYDNNIVIIAQGPETLAFPSAVKIVSQSSGDARSPENVMVLSNNYQKVKANTMNFEEINFRIVMGDVKSLTDGTACQTASIKSAGTTTEWTNVQRPKTRGRGRSFTDSYAGKKKPMSSIYV